MFKKIEYGYQRYLIDYGNVTNNRYPNSYLDIECTEQNPSYKTNMTMNLFEFIYFLLFHNYHHQLFIHYD